MIKSTNIFNFGKYRGLLVAEVANFDPGYIYFCENELNMQFSPRVKRDCRKTSFRKTAYRRSGPMFY